MIVAALVATVAVVFFVLGRLSARRTIRDLREALDWRDRLTKPPRFRRRRDPGGLP